MLFICILIEFVQRATDGIIFLNNISIRLIKSAHIQLFVNSSDIRLIRFDLSFVIGNTRSIKSFDFCLKGTDPCFCLLYTRSIRIYLTFQTFHSLCLHANHTPCDRCSSQNCRN